MIPALIVGGLTAWYLGLRAGAIAAGAVAVALLVANFAPGATFTVYGLVIGWCALLYFFGKGMAGKAQSKSSTFVDLTSIYGRARKLFDKSKFGSGPGSGSGSN